MRRVALVTDAYCAIGAATAIELAVRGASLLLTYLRASALLRVKRAHLPPALLIAEFARRHIARGGGGPAQRTAAAA